MIETEGKFQGFWRIKPGMRFEWRQWGDECVIYNNATGNTHLLGAVALYILDELSKHTAPIHSLAANLFGGDGGKENLDVLQRLSDILLDLHTLELVEPLTE